MQAASSARRLGAQTIEAEIVIRDQPPSGAAVAGILVGVPSALAYCAFRIWGELGMSPDGAPWWLHGTAVISLVVGLVMVLVRVPVWVQVGPSGVAYREWFRQGRRSWDDIDSFELGNPADGRFGYVTVRDHSAIRLPAFRTITPAALVGQLRGKRMIYVNLAAGEASSQRRQPRTVV
jgi:hypothetical protein